VRADRKSAAPESDPFHGHQQEFEQQLGQQAGHRLGMVVGMVLLMAPFVLGTLAMC
jgi:tetrahydromethanopterin S-methyltransferase subunit G